MMAVLLAAALTLTMLTACGGGGSGRGSVDAKVKLTNDINSFLTGSYPKVEYDKALDEYAKTIQASIKMMKIREYLTRFWKKVISG